MNLGRDIRIPSYKYEQLSKVNKVIDSYQAENGDIPSPEYIGEQLGMKPNKVVLLQNEFQDIVSLSESIGDNIYLEDVIGQEDDLETEIIKKDQIIEIYDLLNSALNDREKEILEMRYGLGESKIYTLKEIGVKLNITRERVRQIEKKSIIKLKKYLEDYKDIY